MNDKIKEILIKIEKNSYEAYIVGGYVRDYLLNRKSFDIDIATNMPLKLLIILFKDSTVYEKYNAIKFKIDNYFISITTFRKEISYYKNKPNKLVLTNSLETDAYRRDFTINAIYMDKNMNLIDPLNGTEDINNKIIKVIGNIENKLLEDNTRILRAIRLMSTLNFVLEKELQKYIINNKKLLININFNRKKYELDKIFKSENYMVFFNFIKKYKLKKVFGISFNNIKKSNNYLEIWAQLEANIKYNFTREEKKKIKEINKLV